MYLLPVVFNLIVVLIAGWHQFVNSNGCFKVPDSSLESERCENRQLC